jgi:hypothetical protein
VADIDFDKKDQLERIQALAVAGEILYGVFDMKGGGTGFMGVTDRRIVFMDESFFRKSKALVTVPFTKITAVGVEDSGRSLNPFLATSKLFVVAGSREWEFEFRSNEKAHKAYRLIMSNLLQNEMQGLVID